MRRRRRSRRSRRSKCNGLLLVFGCCPVLLVLLLVASKVVEVQLLVLQVACESIHAVDAEGVVEGLLVD